MSPGLLIFLFFLSVPFLFEAEELGRPTGKFPKLLDLITLRNARKASWFKWFLILLVIWIALLFFSAKSNKNYEGIIPLTLIVLGVQGVLWIFVFCKIKSSKKS